MTLWRNRRTTIALTCSIRARTCPKSLFTKSSCWVRYSIEAWTPGFATCGRATGRPLPGCPGYNVSVGRGRKGRISKWAKTGEKLISSGNGVAMARRQAAKIIELLRSCSDFGRFRPFWKPLIALANDGFALESKCTALHDGGRPSQSCIRMAETPKAALQENPVGRGSSGHHPFRSFVKWCSVKQSVVPASKYCTMDRGSSAVL